MHRFLTSLVRLRSSAVPAFLSLSLLGCGNAPAGAKQVEQATDSGRPLWTPRPIQAPRPALPDSVLIASVTDSIKADSLADSSRGASAKPAKAAKPKRNPF